MHSYVVAACGQHAMFGCTCKHVVAVHSIQCNGCSSLGYPQRCFSCGQCLLNVLGLGSRRSMIPQEQSRFRASDANAEEHLCDPFEQAPTIELWRSGGSSLITLIRKKRLPTSSNTATS